MKFKFRKKRILNNIIGILLTLLIIILIAFLGKTVISNLKNNDGYEKVSLSYERGNLTTYGKYEETKKTIYTKKSCELKYGLKTELEFNSNIKYQFYFYDELDNYIGSSEVYEESVVLTFEECFCAKNFRVVITPNYDSDTKDSEKVVKWYQIKKFANQLKVRCLKEISLNDFTIVADNYNSSIDDTNDIVICDKEHSTLVNKYWYRVFVKKLTDFNGYKIVALSEPNETVGSSLDYDYVIACYSGYNDSGNVLNVFKTICSIEDFSNFGVTFTLPSSAGRELNIEVKVVADYKKL